MKIKLFLIAQLLTIVSFSQQSNRSEPEVKKVTLSGIVKDYKTKETIFGANIYVKELTTT